MKKSSIVYRYLPLFILCMCATVYSYAQIQVSTGIDMSYPLLLNNDNNKPNYGQIGFGLRFGVSYKPTETQFFPTLNFSFGRTRLPLKDFEQNVACVNMDYLNLMLDGNFVVPFENGNALYIIGGIGFAKLNRAGLTISGKNGGAMDIHLDSVANSNKLFPAINLGFEYVYGESNNKNLYMSLGFNFQYIYLLSERNTYYMSVRDYQQNNFGLKAGLVGHVISPNFYITLHYLMGNSIIFWKKKDTGYL